MKKALIAKEISLQILSIILISISISAENRFAKLKVDISPALSNGCKKVPAKKQGEGQCCFEVPAHLDCGKVGLEQKYGCSPIQEVPDYFGGLDPKVPILECIFYKEGNEETNGIQYKGAGMLSVYNKYIVYQDNDFKVLNNAAEFRQFFTPIETSEEALSYAAALTGSYPLYKIEIPKGYKREAKSITTSFVEQSSDGFKVHLFDYEVGGCGPHYHYSIDYLVSKEGKLTEIAQENVWRNPKDDNLCVD